MKFPLGAASLRFRNVDPADRLVAVPARLHSGVDRANVGLQVLLIRLRRDLIDTDRSPCPELMKRSRQHLLIEHVRQRPQSQSWILSG